MTFTDKVKDTIADWLKRIPLILAAIVFLGLMGSGIAIAVFLRSITEMGTLVRMAEVVIPALIIGALAFILMYKLATNFFPKPAREFVDKDEGDLGLPERKKVKA